MARDVGLNLPLGTVGKIKITMKNIFISKERKRILKDYLRLASRRNYNFYFLSKKNSFHSWQQMDELVEHSHY
jgi:hypothetical protein